MPHTSTHAAQVVEGEHHHGSLLSRLSSPAERLKTSLTERATGARAASLANRPSLTTALPEAGSPQRAYGLASPKLLKLARKSRGPAAYGSRKRVRARSPLTCRPSDH
jgi:hypothetical protein